MRLSLKVLPIFLSFLVFSCSLYRSPGRKDFESVFASGAASTSLKSLSLVTCSDFPQRPLSAHINSSFSSNDGLVSYLWQFNDQGKTYYELDNSTGSFCLYEEK